MKTVLGLLGFAMAMSSMAQSSDSSSQSSANTSAVGNQQSITFVTPPDSRSSQSVDSRSAQTITSTGTSTENINYVTSGTSKNIVEYTGSYTMKNVPSVNGPNLTTSNDTCMGSSSGSANGPGFGFSIGTTWSDEHCKRLKMSRELWNKGMKAASLAMDCMDDAARMALEITGTKCPQSMTAEERINNYGPDASAQAAYVPAQRQTVGSSEASATPVSDGRNLSAYYPN